MSFEATSPAGPLTPQQRRDMLRRPPAFVSMPASSVQTSTSAWQSHQSSWGGLGARPCRRSVACAASGGRWRAPDGGSDDVSAEPYCEHRGSNAASPPRPNHSTLVSSTPEHSPRPAGSALPYRVHPTLVARPARPANMRSQCLAALALLLLVGRCGRKLGGRERSSVRSTRALQGRPRLSGTLRAGRMRRRTPAGACAASGGRTFRVHESEQLAAGGRRRRAVFATSPKWNPLAPSTPPSLPRCPPDPPSPPLPIHPCCVCSACAQRVTNDCEERCKDDIKPLCVSHYDTK